MATINYRELGSGPSLILIHGFPMNQQVWVDFAEKLGETAQVITLDLPGFGKSQPLSGGFTIEDVATQINSFIRERGYVNPVLIGHSLGGYVSLAMIELQPDLFGGLCLFHSTALADSDEKKESRNKVLEFIAKHGVEAFTSNFIGPLYVDPQHSSITRVKNIAVQADRATVEGYTIAMRDRKDRRHVLKSFSKPLLFIAGEKDAGIPVDTVRDQAALNPNSDALILPEVGHMGMFESEAGCLKKIKSFIAKCQVTFRQEEG